MARGGWFRRTARNGAAQANIPEGLWSKCPHCNEISFAKDVERNLQVCPKCDYHHALRARDRVAMLVDEESWEELGGGLASTDPIGFPDYPDKMAKGQTKTGLNDGMLTGRARIEGQPLILGVADFGFMGGSMGSVTGEKLARAMEIGASERLPVVVFTASGGARMQEGLISLMQMAKTSASAAKLDRAGVPYIVVLTHPTTGGVYASYASLGDVILAEPGALIGFAGQRVAKQDLGVKLPEDFQTAEFQFRCGMLDRITPRKEMRSVLGRLLGFLGEERAAAEQERVYA